MMLKVERRVGLVCELFCISFWDRTVEGSGESLSLSIGPPLTRKSPINALRVNEVLKRVLVLIFFAAGES